MRLATVEQRALQARGNALSGMVQLEIGASPMVYIEEAQNWLGESANLLTSKGLPFGISEAASRAKRHLRDAAYDYNHGDLWGAYHNLNSAAEFFGTTARLAAAAVEVTEAMGVSQ